MGQGGGQMRKAVVVLLGGLILAGCNQTVQIAKPCGVITDPLKDVQATTRDGNRRISTHFERGVSAKCWGR